MTSRPLFFSLVLIAAYAQGCIFSEDFGSSGGTGDPDGGVIAISDMGDMQDMDEDKGSDVSDMPEPIDPCAEVTCQDGETCVDGECKCGASDACAGDAMCIVGECRVVECVEGADSPNPGLSCDAGEVCVEFKCVPAECEMGSGSCMAGFVCDPNSRTCQPGCTSDSDCPDANSACVESKGVCVDLLSDSKNCGAKGVTCNMSLDSECIDGLCTCGSSSPSEQSSLSKPVFDKSNFTIWPPAELMAYPTPALYVCPDSSVSIEECPNARFDEDYGLGEPHFVAIGALRPSGMPLTSSIELRTLDGRGRQIGTEETYSGKANLGERKLLKLKIVPFGLERTKIFALWEGENNMRTVVSYDVQRDDAAESRVALQRDNFVWAKAQHITDFSVGLWEDKRDVSRPLFIVAVPIAVARGGDLASGVLGVRGYALASETDYYPIASPFYEVPDLGQVLRDFGMTMTENSEGEPELHAVILDGTHYGDVHPEGEDPPAFFSKAYYNRYAFEFSELEMTSEGTVMKATEMSELRTTVGSTLLNVVEVIGIFLSGDESILPAPFFAFWQGMNFVTLGWSRVKGTSDVSTYVYRALGANDVTANFGNPLINSTVYDSRLAFENADDVYLYRIDVRINGNATEDISQVMAAKLITEEPLQLSEARAISPPIKARRLRAVTGPHVAGILVTSRDQGASGKAELYFAAGGNKAVCKPANP